MRFSTALSVSGLLGLAVALPQQPSDGRPYYPPVLKSRGFTLVVNVIDRANDFYPPIHGFYLSGIHAGAGTAVAGITSANGRIFYQNGTETEADTYRSNILSDSGLPAFPSGIVIEPVQESDTLSHVYLNAGAGTRGVFLSDFPQTYVSLQPESFVACNEVVPYYGDRQFVVIKQANYSIYEQDVDYNIPPGCIRIRLVPQCTMLGDLAPGSHSSHEFAFEANCYDDVSQIRWAKEDM
ncbi:hypothetical protein B0I35DRAFT_432005 [Stachybotrys elegans]|uniref:DUF7907 domain-containing protein n=1 Tax=Stachybotrys elegans TaxID=80388 RepID=A0A8K0SRM7_9HYPO|nr:hypothetical protein B0I35DRAFT_432005 [Stachybotrys elegans]